MVTTHLLVHNARFHKLDVLWCVWFKLALADQKVVDSPPSVGLSVLVHIRPVRVLSAVWVQMPISVDESSFKQLGEVCTFLWREAWDLILSLWVVNVYFIMSNV